MARHRDIRNMDYEDEYDGYDDIYGHSVDDDYYISPSNRQFIYNRETSRDSRFEHADDIQEVDEIEELSDTDKAKLNSCIDQVKNTLGQVAVPRSELVNLILKHKFNVEMVINAVLEDAKYEKSGAAAKDKGVTELFKKLSQPKGFTVPNIFGSPKSLGKSFVIPSIFSSASSNLDNENAPSPPKGFTVPNIFGSPKGKNVVIFSGSSSSNLDNENFNSLSELVSSHLKTNNLDVVIDKVSEISVSDEPPVKCKSLASNEPVNSFNIDLSVALKASSSLPIFSKNKAASKNFEIPFIDGDLVSRKATNNLAKVKCLPCTLDVSETLRDDIKISKKPSKLAKVLCRKYRHANRESLFTPKLEFKQNNQKPIRVFMFHTRSPDDYISSFLNRR